VRLTQFTSPATELQPCCSHVATQVPDTGAMNENSHWRRNPVGRRGVCHRCGWRETVTRVGRRDRKVLGTGQHYGRLCGDCRVDLTAGHSAPRRVNPVRSYEPKSEAV
jgi:hypothetical protein